MHRACPTRASVPLGGALTLATLFAFGPSPLTAPAPAIQFVVTADAHYGITRPAFRGRHDVDAHIVNRALVATLNTLPRLELPLDGGIGAGHVVGAVDFVVEAGDITNREERADGAAVQPAAVSWAQFVNDYIDGLRLATRTGTPTPVLMVPGNHEASNAIGFYKAMSPPTDPTPLIAIFNRMIDPPAPLTPPRPW